MNEKDLLQSHVCSFDNNSQVVLQYETQDYFAKDKQAVLSAFRAASDLRTGICSCEMKDKMKSFHFSGNLPVKSSLLNQSAPTKFPEIHSSAKAWCLPSIIR